MYRIVAIDEYAIKNFVDASGNISKEPDLFDLFSDANDAINELENHSIVLLGQYEEEKNNMLNQERIEWINKKTEGSEILKVLLLEKIKNMDIFSRILLKVEGV